VLQTTPGVVGNVVIFTYPWYVPSYDTVYVGDWPGVAGLKVDWAPTETEVTLADAIATSTNGVAIVARSRVGKRIFRKRFITVRQSQSSGRRIRPRSHLKRHAGVTVYAVIQGLKSKRGAPTRVPRGEGAFRSGSRVDFHAGTPRQNDGGVQVHRNPTNERVVLCLMLSLTVPTTGKRLR
jgi:hypothetical protein